MRTTRRYIRGLVRQILKEGAIDPGQPDKPTRPEPGMPPGVSEADDYDIEFEHGDTEGYKRGYQDGLDGYPMADDADTDYDAGYEDGAGDAGGGQDRQDGRQRGRGFERLLRLVRQAEISP